MSRADYESVCERMRLADDTLWPIPITLYVSEELAREAGAGDSVTLRDPEGVMLAALHVEEAWRPDRQHEAMSVYGTSSSEHPGPAYLFKESYEWYVAGRLEGIRPPASYDFKTLRLSPADILRPPSRRFAASAAHPARLGHRGAAFPSPDNTAAGSSA